MVELPDGKAETIVTALEKFMEEKNLPMQQLIGLGSDGASVMVGRKSGVSFISNTKYMYMYNINHWT